MLHNTKLCPTTLQSLVEDLLSTWVVIKTWLCISSSVSFQDYPKQLVNKNARVVYVLYFHKMDKVRISCQVRLLSSCRAAEWKKKRRRLKIFWEIDLIYPHTIVYNLSLQHLLVVFSVLYFWIITLPPCRYFHNLMQLESIASEGFGKPFLPCKGINLCILILFNGNYLGLGDGCNSLVYWI